MTTDFEFFARLAESQLVSAAEISALQERAKGGGIDQLAQELQDAGKLTSYQAEALRAGRSEPLILDAYVLIDEIGQGGMGRVFKARHRFMNRIVALKLIRPELLASAGAVARFRREVHAAARVSHPNLVVAYDAGEAEGRHYLAMEHCEGITLNQLVHQAGPLLPGQACEYIRQAALGLQHASERGLVHRDIKPSNLMICDHQLKILDLGLARLRELVQQVGESLMQTEAGVAMGTPDFIAPEQAKNSHNADARADIYSLGCTLYFALSGRVPFPGGTGLEKMLRHQSEEPRSLIDLCRNLPPGLFDVWRKMTAKDPQDRFATPVAVATALEPFAVAETSDVDLAASTHEPMEESLRWTGPIPTLPPRPAEPLVALATEQLSDCVTLSNVQDGSIVHAAKPAASATAAPVGRSNRRVLAAGGIAVTILLPLLFWAVLGGNRGKPAATPNNGGQLSQSHVAEVEKLGDWPLYKRLGPHTAQVNATAFSHNDRLLAVGCGTEWNSEPGVVQLWDVATGEKAGTLSEHNTGVSCVAFAPPPHGHVLAAGTGKIHRVVPAEVRLWNCETRKCLTTLGGFPSGVNVVTFSPQGWMATAGGHADHAIKIWNLAILLKQGDATTHEGHPALIKTLNTSEWICSLNYSSNGETLLVGSGRSVRRWTVSDWTELPTLTLPYECGQVSRATWCGDGRLVAAVTSTVGTKEDPPPDSAIAVWRVDRPTEPPQMISYSPSLGTLVFLPRANSLIVGDQDGFVSRWNLAALKRDWQEKAARSWVFSIATSAHHRLLATNDDADVNLWRVASQ